jgi:hypothetical protein
MEIYNKQPADWHPDWRLPDMAMKLIHPLELSTPEQHDFSDPTVERNEKRLRTWLINLPLMDVTETVRLVLGALNSLNQQKLETETRFQLLSIYADTAQRLFVTMEPSHLRQLALSKSQQLQATEGVNQLLLAMADGYKLVIKSLYTAVDVNRPERLFGMAIKHAMEQLGYALLDSYRYYRAVPPMVFPELHQLYRIARHYGLLELADERSHDTEMPLTISANYHATLLLALVDPFRLVEGEVAMLHHVLVQHADKCRVIPGGNWPDAAEGLFFVDLRSGAGPVAHPPQEMPRQADEPYILDAREALQAIHDQLDQTPVKVRMQSPEAMILRRLWPEVVDLKQQREPRETESGEIGLLLGLMDIHGYLSKAVSTLPDTPLITLTQPVEPSPGQIINSSENGRRLYWEEGACSSVCVGELMGLVEEGGRLTLAMVRNMRISPEGGMEIGVQLIHGPCAPIYCRASGDEESIALPALFMPGDETQQATTSLVTVKGDYAEDSRILINVAGREIRARVGLRLLETPVFKQFEFSTGSKL